MAADSIHAENAGENAMKALQIVLRLAMELRRQMPSPATNFVAASYTDTNRTCGDHYCAENVMKALQMVLRLAMELRWQIPSLAMNFVVGSYTDTSRTCGEDWKGTAFQFVEVTWRNC